MTSTRVDGHVHFYRLFSLPEFLRAARVHFQGADGVLLLAQPDEAPPFALLERRLSELDGEWEFCKPDPTAYVFRQENATIVIIAGRQIVTRENLEVLTLCTAKTFRAGRPLSDAIDDTLQNNAIPVIPWGFGKWWFARGNVMRQLIQTRPHGYLLGDSGCRPTIGAEPILVAARRRGIGVLAGSDPLPTKSHETRAGSFYSVILDRIDLSSPTAWIRGRLSDATSFTNQGVRRSPVQFLSDQIRIRFS